MIGPRAELVGFRQTDFLKELQVVRRWLERQTGVEEVLIDVEGREFLRGRTLAGLVLLRNNVPEGAEFGVCGESELLDAVLDKMDADEEVPVFPDTASAFDYTQPSRSAIFGAQARSAVSRWKGLILKGAVATAVVAAMVALVVTLKRPAAVRDYRTMLSIWEQTQALRQENPESSTLDRHREASRETLAELTARYRAGGAAAASEEDGYALAAATALFENLMTSTGTSTSETEFFRAMQVIAAKYSLPDVPQRTQTLRNTQRALLE